ncbi:MAG: 3-dehydroquinate synthase family protein [Elusimicrobiales bacterium]
MTDFLIDGKKFSASFGGAAEFEVKSVPRPYNVVWDENPDAFAGIRELMSCPGNILLADEKVLRLHGGGFDGGPRMMKAEATEEFKTLSGVTALIELLMKSGFTKGETLAVAGGGIMEDAGAFAGAVYKRGINWTFFPTTLLAMCDSCIGGKTGINHGGAKNQLALFSAPRRVVINPNFLKTLERRDILSGMGEILKLFITGGPEYIALYKATVRNGVPAEFSGFRTLLLNSLAIKRAVVEEDEFELNHRRALNYGHTAGHAAESLSGYAIPHGQAVAIGIIIANELAVRRGLLPAGECAEIKTLALDIIDAQSMLAMRALPTENLLALLQKDKKAVSGGLFFALIKNPGETVFVRTALDEKLRSEISGIIKTEFR